MSIDRKQQMLKACLCIGCFIPLMSAHALDVRLSTSQAPVNKRVELRITSETARPNVEDLPAVEGIRWEDASRSFQKVRIINGKRTTTYSRAVFFKAVRPGRYKIPPFKVVVNGQPEKTPELTFRGVEEGEKRDGGAGAKKNASAGQRMRVEFRLKESSTLPESLYVGEKVPLQIKVYILARAYHSVGYPDLTIRKATFRTVDNRSRRAAKFLGRTEISRVQRWGETYVMADFRSVFTPTAPGPLEGTCKIVAKVQEEQREGRGNRRLNSMLGRRATEIIRRTKKIPEMSVKPLPPVPEEKGHFLGLIGQWNLQFQLHPENELRTGETSELRVNIEGSGNPERIDPPEISMDGFRVFSPEIKNMSDSPEGPQKLRLVWLMTPKRPGKELLPLEFSTFDPAEGEYRSHEFSPQIEVAGSNLVKVDSDSEAEVTESEEESGRGEDPQGLPLVLKEQLKGDIRRVLFSGATVLLVLALGIYAYSVWSRGRRERDAGSHGFRRWVRARRQRRELVAALKGMDSERRAERVVHEKLVPYLSAVLGLAPGVTCTELAAQLEEYDPEFAEMLRKADRADFSSRGPSDISGQRLLERLRKMGMICFFVAVLSVF